MASREHRVAQNIVGKYYVDDSCILCDLCVETAPTVFKQEMTQGVAYVFHQPTTDEEHMYAMEAYEGCPTESIGYDGDTFGPPIKRGR